MGDGKLNKQALDDCANYLEQLTETKRDRGTNLWAQMLYAMLVLDFCFDVKRAEEIVEWVVHRAAGAKVLQTTRGGLGAAERFLVAFQKYRADKPENTRSVMGTATPENTIFWHNMRTSSSVRSGPFKGGPRRVPHGLEGVLGVRDAGHCNPSEGREGEWSGPTDREGLYAATVVTADLALLGSQWGSLDGAL